jgi:Secretion system C-terminal sorting domain
MKKINHFFQALCMCTLLFACDNPTMPKPTDDTVVREDMEENERKDLKSKWLEMLHGGPNSDWRNIEYNNMFDLLRYKSSLASPSRDGEELLAGGNLYGKWIERGATNVAGSVVNFYYDTEDDLIYAITAGGSLFKGGLNGFSWEVVNDDLKFNSELIESITLAAGTKRLIAGINSVPHYSDDGGATWTISSGLPSAQGGNNIQSAFFIKGKLYILHRKSGSAKYILYSSSDGQKYDIVQLMTTADDRGIDMAINATKDSLYILEKRSSDYARLSSLNFSTNKMTILSDSCALSFGSERVNLQVSGNSNTTKIVSYDADLMLKVSENFGNSWEDVSLLKSNPWDVGVFVSPSKPNQMLYGEVNAYRSSTNGENWFKVNDWAEYYGNVIGKLHADIMVIKEFKDQNNKPFILIGHHGGISKTYDYGNTTENITLFGMNNSQYYDARSYPNDPSWIFAGAQDQGMQRGNVTDELIGDFFQMISGDYGHVEFTNGGNSMWIMYPGGSLSFYRDPLSQKFPTTGYAMEKDNDGAWIPQVTVNPHSNQDIVYLAGGSTTGSGSYIIKVKFDGVNSLDVENMPFNFSTSGGSLSAIAISPIDEKVWYAATSNGKVYKSVNKGQSFKLMQSMVSEGQYLYGSCILPSKLDSNVIYLSGSGYGPSPVYKSIDAGKTFLPMKTGMPATVAFNVVANADETKLYAATEAGPYVYIAKENKWYPMSGANTPTQTYWSVEYVDALKAVRFGTYGRGVWEFKESPLAASDEPLNEVSVKIGPNPSSDYVYIESRKMIDKIELYDQSGKKLRVLIQDSKIDVSELNNGIYFVKVYADKKSLTKKILKI